MDDLEAPAARRLLEGSGALGTALSLTHPILILPGLGGSDPEHWQSIWERDIPNARRVQQVDWDAPRLELWLPTLRQAVERTPGAILVAHSLGCVLAAHLAARYPEANIAGALIVAPPDVKDPLRTPPSIREFAPVPRMRLPFPAILVASQDDPYAASECVAELASAWGADLVDVGRRGHINVAAGVGRWAEGLEVLQRLAGRCVRKPSTPELQA